MKCYRRSTVSRRALDDVYDVMFQHVKQRVQNSSDFGCITLDGWSDRYKRNSYFTFTYHTITDDFNLERFVLQTSVCYGKKTAQQVCTEVTNVLERFEILGKDIYYVTDAGANMVAGLRLMEVNHHLCIGHGIHNLVSQDGIKKTPSLQSVCMKSKAACKTVKYRSPDLEREAQKEQYNSWLDNVLEVDTYVEADDENPILSDLNDIGDDGAHGPDLDQVCLLNQTTPTTVKLPVPTRWHTLLIMLESMEQNKGPINTVLTAMGKDDLKFTAIELATIRSLVQFLASFRKVVEILSAEKSCTINLALLLRSELEASLREDDEDSLAIVDLKRRMLAKLDHRFPVTKLVVTAALLDPRCSDLAIVLHYLSKHNSTKETFLVDQIKDCKFKIAGVSMPNQADAATSSSLKKTTAQELMHLSKKHSVGESSRAAALEKECRLFISSSSPEDVQDNNILRYWKERKHQFPWLSTAARKFLCVQATSTPSERVFSIAGLTVTAK